MSLRLIDKLAIVAVAAGGIAFAFHPTGGAGHQGGGAGPLVYALTLDGAGVFFGLWLLVFQRGPGRDGA